MPLPLPTAAQPATLTATRVATIATRTFFIVGPCFPLLSLTRVHTKIAQCSSAQRPHWVSKHLSAPDSNRTERVISCGSSGPCGASARTPRWRAIAPWTPQVVLNSAIWLEVASEGLRLARVRGRRAGRSRGPGRSGEGRGDSIPVGGAWAACRTPSARRESRRPCAREAVCWSTSCRRPHNAAIAAFTECARHGER